MALIAGGHMYISVDLRLTLIKRCAKSKHYSDLNNPYVHEITRDKNSLANIEKVQLNLVLNTELQAVL